MDDVHLNTPIKKIEALNLRSAQTTSFRHGQPHSKEAVDRAYPKTLTNNVLKELNARAEAICLKIKLPQSPTEPKNISRSRYNKIHRTKFDKMDSIADHYSVKGLGLESPGNNGKRIVTSEDSTAKRRKALTGTAIPSSYSNSNRSLPQSSPLKGISPSKRSHNLHQLLKEGQGDLHTSNIGTKGSQPVSSPELSETTKVPGLTERVSSNQTDNQNQSKLQRDRFSPRSTVLGNRNTKNANYISNRRRVDRSSELENRRNISMDTNRQESVAKILGPRHEGTLKENIPSLQAFQTSTNFIRSPSVPLAHSNTLNRKDKENIQHPCDKKKEKISGRKMSHGKFLDLKAIQRDYSFTHKKEPKFTVPKPFSLYNKPTISSSQKSIHASSKNQSH